MRAIGTGQFVGAALAQTAGIALMLFSGRLDFGRTVWHLGNVLPFASAWIVMWCDKEWSRPARGRDVFLVFGVLAGAAGLFVALKVWGPDDSALAGAEWVFSHPGVLLPLWALMLFGDFLRWRKGRESGSPQPQP